MNEPVPEVIGDFIPLRVTFERKPHVIFVGDLGRGVARVQVNEHWCAVTPEGRWTSPPIQYYPGLEVTVRIVNGSGETREISAVLPGPDALGPVFGPDWTAFGPPSA